MIDPDETEIFFDKWSTLRADGGMLIRSDARSEGYDFSSYGFPLGETITEVNAMSKGKARVTTTAGVYVARAGDPSISPQLELTPLYQTCPFDDWSILKAEGGTLHRVTNEEIGQILATYAFPEGEEIESLTTLSAGRVDVITNKGGYMVRGKHPGMTPDIDLVVIYIKA